MSYSLENIYRTVGKDDKVAALTLKSDSESCDKYGKEPTVVFLYSQSERDEMDKQIIGNASTHGVVKAKVLFYNFSVIGLKSKLPEEVEVNSQDIEDIYYLPFNLNHNTFHSAEKRTINKLEIETSSMPYGGDWDWYYGFEKMRVEEKGIILSPEERNRYLAMKLFYEPHEISNEENKEIFACEGMLNEAVGYHYFMIKKEQVEVKDEIKEKLELLAYKRLYKKREKLNEYLVQAGSSLKKLMKEDVHFAAKLFIALSKFKERRLNVLGRHPIYMDDDSYLHIFTRHVEEFKFNKHYQLKDNFQWFEEDVIMVMKKVIEEIDEEYQEFRSLKPTSRYSRYNDDSIYFEGDYYTLHIEPSGRIDTFHNSRKVVSNL